MHGMGVIKLRWVIKVMNEVIESAHERISHFDSGLLQKLEESRPTRVWEKAHTYPMSQQDLFEHTDCDPTDWEHMKEVDEPARVYVQIPWCEEKCTFCGYDIKVVGSSKENNDEKVDRYFAALRKEFEQKMALLRRRRLSVEHLYIGGGTPSVLDPDQIDELFDIINAHVDFVDDPFLIAECSPGTITYDKALAFRRNGIGRMSMGVQSFDDDVLKKIRRDHTAEDAKKAYQMLRDVGFPEINFDILLALPGQNYETFFRSVEEAIKLAPSSLCLIDLHVRPRTKLATEGFEHNFYTNVVMRAMYQQMMKDTPFNQTRPHYYVLPDEMPHPATRCPMLDARVDGFQLGFGSSATSHLGDVITINEKNATKYAKLVQSGELFVQQAYRLTEQDKISMRALRTLNDTAVLSKRKAVLDYFKDEIQFMQDRGLMNQDLRLTEDGNLFGTEVCFLLYPK